MNKKELIKVINDLWNNYDAFLFYNKYEENTHKKQFELLEERFKQDEMSMKAIKWIKNCYDCFYKEDFNDDKSAFAYLKKQLED